MEGSTATSCVFDVDRHRAYRWETQHIIAAHIQIEKEKPQKINGSHYKYPPTSEETRTTKNWPTAEAVCTQCVLDNNSVIDAIAIMGGVGTDFVNFTSNKIVYS